MCLGDVFCPAPSQGPATPSVLASRRCATRWLIQGMRPLRGWSQMMAHLAHGLVLKTLKVPGTVTGHAAQRSEEKKNAAEADKGAERAKAGDQAEGGRAKEAESAF